VSFWDSSAIVPLCLHQVRTAHARSLLKDDPRVVVWWVTPVECASAFARLVREGILHPAHEGEARATLDDLRASWTEVLPTPRIRSEAERLVRLHPLRGADALQLSAALDWSGSPAGERLITFDRQLAEAARRQGFTVPQSLEL